MNTRYRMSKAAVIMNSISPASISTMLVGLCGVCIFSYVYFVAASVLDVVVRQDSEKQAATLQSEIASLETELITAQHTISSRLATQEGYEEEQEKVFLVRGNGDNLVLNSPVQ